MPECVQSLTIYEIGVLKTGAIQETDRGTCRMTQITDERDNKYKIMRVGVGKGGVLAVRKKKEGG